MSALDMGLHDVELRCPDCKAAIPIEAEFTTVRTAQTDDEATTLRLRVKAKRVDHRCGEPTLFDDEP